MCIVCEYQFTVGNLDNNRKTIINGNNELVLHVTQFHIHTHTPKCLAFNKYERVTHIFCVDVKIIYNIGIYHVLMNVDKFRAILN